MSYEPTIWKKGDKVTSTKLNKIENGIQGNDTEISNLKEGLTQMTTATASDVGKALKAKTVADGKVAEWEFGETGVAVDPTLTIEGKAADAKSVGDRFDEITDDVQSVSNAVMSVKNLIDTSSYVSKKTSNIPTANGDGTWTFSNTGYGTTIWQSMSEVPSGKYTLQGIAEGYGRTFVTTNSLYDGLILENRTSEDVEFENPTDQTLFLGVRIDRTPSETHVFYPHIDIKELNVVVKSQGVENRGKVLAIGDDGNVVPQENMVSTDKTLTKEGVPADAKVVGTKFNEIESVISENRIVIQKEVGVTGSLNGNVEAVIGVLIPQGSSAKVTISTDIDYDGDNIYVQYNDNALFTQIDWANGNRLYVAPITVTVPDGNTFCQNVRVILRKIKSESGSINITVTCDLGKMLTGFDNILPYKEGENLINPRFVYPHVNFGNNYIIRSTSEVSVGWIPIAAGGTVSFNRAVSKMTIVSQTIDGTYDSFIKDADKITNQAETDAFVVFAILTQRLSDLIAVNGEYSADYVPYNPIGGYVEKHLDQTYGTIGMWYTDEAENIKRIDSNQHPNRLRFVHISDTHQSSNDPIKCMGEFTDLSGAKFLTITGDMVNNSISNDFEKTKDQILAMTKPCYICMGNHDVWGDTAETQRYTKYFNPIATHNGLAQDVSYYSVDFAAEKVKCIWLDVYELSTGTPANIMSDTQINWFLNQLDDAIANAYHVCVFLHQPLTDIGTPVNSFFDHSLMTAPVANLKWILDTVKAFQDGTSVEFTHNGNNFTHTFGGHGVFVSYFNGHTHYDEVGWCKDYNQFNVTINRFNTSGEAYDMTYRAEKLGIVSNYVAIDTSARRLSVVRVGNNNTICGIKRDAFTVLY